MNENNGGKMEGMVDRKIAAIITVLALAGGGSVGTFLGAGVSVERYEGLVSDVQRIDTRVERLEQQERVTMIELTQMKSTLLSIDEKLDRIEKRLER